MGVSRDYRVRKSFQGGNTKGETVVYVNLSKGETPRGRLSCTYIFPRGKHQGGDCRVRESFQGEHGCQQRLSCT